MEHVPFNGKEAEQQALQIFTTLNTIHERFIQYWADAEEAKRYLSGPKNFKAIQCKRATESLFKPDDPVDDLYELLRKRPLPAKIDLQLHGISLTLQQIEKHKKDLRSYIDAFTSSNHSSRGEGDRNKQEDIIRSVRSLAEQLNQLIGLLSDVGEPIVSSTPVTAINRTPSELTPQSEPQKHLPVPTNTPTFTFPLQLMAAQYTYKLLQLIASLLGATFTLYHRLSSKSSRQKPTAAPSSPGLEGGRTAQESMKMASLPNTAVDPTIIKDQNKEQFDHLNGLLANNIEDLDLQQICRKVRIDYQSLNDKSHATRAFSLTSKMEKQARLNELEQELRNLLPNHFPDHQ